MAVAFFLVGMLFRALAGLGHREKMQKDVEPVWWVRLIARMLGSSGHKTK
jgi:hypothetical protein